MATTATAAAASTPTSSTLTALTAVAAAPRSSTLGHGLSKEQRVCLLGLVALSLPPEDQALGRWNVLMLNTVARLLRLEDGHWMALQPLLYSEGNDPAIRQVQLEAFRKPFFPEESESESAAALDQPPPPRAQAKAPLLSSAGEQGQESEEERCHTLRRAVLRDVLVHLACAAMYDARSRRVLMAMAADAFELDWREIARVRGLSIVQSVSIQVLMNSL